MADENTKLARFNMIEQQIRPWEVLDRYVLDTLAKMPREKFVPDAYRGLAFADLDIPIGHSESMMAPKIEGRMLQALGIGPQDNVLEIGTGSGFITACLANLSSRVTSIDIHADFVERARQRLDELARDNIDLRVMDGLSGGSPNGPFDAIAVTGSLPQRQTVEKFQNQLRIGGRLFVIVGESPLMEALLFTRIGETDFRVESLFETDIKALVNAPVAEHFEF